MVFTYFLLVKGSRQLGTIVVIDLLIECQLRPSRRQKLGDFCDLGCGIVHDNSRAMFLGEDLITGQGVSEWHKVGLGGI